ncbi:mycothiol synthase [Corynebacterium hindlerae]|uniref:mycothiol synthase n=1 Tax=Corynebacterium hindlerae TaxID=699041 RepID=UPI001AD61DC4|nr:mycothiol synthase [Corynebacterium hindlerae]QTH59457.1 mycothiol synthase [Corynebacterium hindlerae]
MTTFDIQSDQAPLHPDVHALIERAASTDGCDPFSEQFLLGLSDPRLGHIHLIARVGEDIVGVLAHDGATAELVVDPGWRRQGIASALIDAHGPGAVWAHGDLVPAQHLAARLAATKTRELLVMRLTEPAPRAEIPAGYEVMSLAAAREQWGERADAELLRVNNEAFSWHPEQGGWDMQRWERAQEAHCFDPEGVLLLWEAPSGGEATKLAGFHWTKCLRSHQVSGEETVGEVYVVGLADNARGQGLGKPITLVGINHMQKHGYKQVILYVEAENRPAVATYESLGFSVIERHSLYRVER